ncbi:dihydrofolate reductase [Mucilaginibacter hurinus]|uniref:Dihydrofolate reductase n=1 Tax=Mucilaginibacter hurinus TaxID=2201324 RepID=A0A367GUH0_9SPHI|nr:dihydrofolate reductase [Mucilaginibacter hurinus]RCH56441.1 dihydrofolate reductase [Mucilaginibacter hurinus]
MIVNIIVATSSNNAIGKNNQLLWHMPNDLKHFKEKTTGHTIIMGRKTFDSVGKPLPRRRNIVITRQHITIEGCEVVHSLAGALDLCIEEDEVFIVGGAEIYRQALDITDRIYLTIIHEFFEGDTFFPELDNLEWKESTRDDRQPDEKHAFPYSFITLERR